MIEGVLERLPHGGPMLFLDEVLEAEGTRCVARKTLSEDFVMLRDGRCSPLVAIEFFAQTAAALMAWRAADRGAGPVTGALLGSRSLSCHVESLELGDRLRIEVEERWGAGALAQFQCTLFREGDEGDELAAEGAINVAAGPVGAPQ